MTDWFLLGCSIDCEEAHTFEWGRCAIGPEWTTEPIKVEKETGKIVEEA